MSPLSRGASVGVILTGSSAVADMVVEITKHGHLWLGPGGWLMVACAIGAALVWAWSVLRDSLLRAIRSGNAVRLLWVFGIQRTMMKTYSDVSATLGSPGVVLHPDFANHAKIRPIDMNTQRQA